jgi:alpha-beta hydrolase superfamily lysophospholipase
VVYADDHRGHGKTAGDLSKAGIAGEDGWNGMINDEKQLSEIIQKENMDLPLFLFGHSMGSFLVQGYIERWGSELKGVILSGSTGLAIFPPEVIPYLEQAAAGEARDNFPDAAGSLLSPFNEPFQPARTPFDWLSRDEAEVQKYLDDPWCGFDFSHGLTLDLARGMIDMLDPQNQALVPKDLPVLIVSGEMDPVGMNNGVRVLEQRYKELGIKVVQVILYPECRHETLNETNRDEVHRDVTRWLDEQMQ